MRRIQLMWPLFQVLAPCGPAAALQRCTRFCMYVPHPPPGNIHLLLHEGQQNLPLVSSRVISGLSLDGVLEVSVLDLSGHLLCDVSHRPLLLHEMSSIYLLEVMESLFKLVKQLDEVIVLRLMGQRQIGEPIQQDHSYLIYPSKVVL